MGVVVWWKRGTLKSGSLGVGEGVKGHWDLSHVCTVGRQRCHTNMKQSQSIPEGPEL